MSGGGGSQTVTTQNGPPQQYLDAYSQVMARANDVAGQPYQPYGGPLLADLQPNQLAGINQVAAANGSYQPYYDQARQLLTQANAPLAQQVQPYTNAAQSHYDTAANANLGQALAPWQAQAAQGFGQGSAPVTPTQFSAGQVQQYLSPYTQNVVNATQAQFTNQNQQAQAALRGNAASQGALGGDRLGVAQAQLANQQQLAQAPVIAGLYNQGYGQALNEFNTQQQTGLSAQQMSRQLQQQAAQGYAGLGNQALTAAQQQAGLQLQAGQGYAGLGQQMLGAGQAQGWLSAQTGAQMAGLGQQQFNSQLQGANALMGAGALQQQQAQQGLNIPYEQYLAGQSYPYQTTGWLANIAEGIGGSAGGRGSTTSPGPSALSQAAGLGMVGLGLNNAGAFNGLGSAIGSGYNALFGSGMSGAMDAASASGAFAAESAAAAGADGIASGAGQFAGLLAAANRGGRIAARAGGGEVPNPADNGIGVAAPGVETPITGLGGGIPNVDSYVPGAAGLGSAPAAPGKQPYILGDYGSTRKTETQGKSPLGSIVKTAASLAANIYAPGSGMLVNAGLSAAGLGRGGLVPPGGGLAAGGTTPMPYSDDITIDATSGVPHLSRSFVPAPPQFGHGTMGPPKPPPAYKADDPMQQANSFLGDLKRAGLDTPPADNASDQIAWRGGIIRGLEGGGVASAAGADPDLGDPLPPTDDPDLPPALTPALRSRIEGLARTPPPDEPAAKPAATRSDTPRSDPPRSDPQAPDVLTGPLEVKDNPLLQPQPGTLGGGGGGDAGVVNPATLGNPPEASDQVGEQRAGLGSRDLLDKQLAGELSHLHTRVAEKPDPWMYLALAGLNTMGGTTPWAGVNIGRGAAAGLSSYLGAEKSAKELATKVDENVARLLETQEYRRENVDARYHNTDQRYNAALLGVRQREVAANEHFQIEQLKQQARQVGRPVFTGSTTPDGYGIYMGPGGEETIGTNKMNPSANVQAQVDQKERDRDFRVKKLEIDSQIRALNLQAGQDRVLATHADTVLRNHPEYSSEQVMGEAQRMMGASPKPDIGAVPGARPQIQPQAAPPAPLPARPQDAVIGRTYQTSKGPLVWDGKMFLPVAPSEQVAP